MTTPPQDAEFKIGPYAVIRHIAQGGMGAVYEVEHPEKAGRFALKLGRSEVQGDASMFEVHRVLSSIPHPGVVTSHAVGTTPDGRSFQLLDLIDGHPAQVFAKSMGTPGTNTRTTAVITVAIHVSEALEHLHKNKIIHRDIKSANVMVRSDKSACLIDFGSAILPGRSSNPGHFVGTYTYAPPEQIRGERLDNRTDLYAMGVLLYRMLTGKRPFQADSTEALIQKHLHQSPISPDQLTQGIPNQVTQVIMAMLEKRPEHRPETAHIVSQTLRQA